MPTYSRENPHATSLVARTLWRRARLQMRLRPLYHLRLPARLPDHVRAAPPDLRLADPQLAHDIYCSRFPLAGHMVDTGGMSPFQVEAAHPGWLKSLHAFRWLRHLSAAGTELAGANARALISDWIAYSSDGRSKAAWEPGTTAKRIIAWLQHSSLILAGADLPFYRAFIGSMVAQVRYLRAQAPVMERGKDRLRVRIAIAFASLALFSSPSGVRNAARKLDAEIETQILPDGGHVSRNPLAVLELLADLLPLRQTYASQSEMPPPALISAIDRMMPALRFFRHADGSMARFNGMGQTLAERINAVLRHDDTAAAALLHAPHSGYERLALGPTVVIADAGTVPPSDASTAAHAGCLSFELSSDRSCFVVNCGVDSFGRAELKPVARATAAHSTATLNDRSQGRFDHAPRLHRIIGAPLIGGARTVTSDRLETEWLQGVVAEHDAYAQAFGLTHQRELLLGDGGNLLSGVDRFLAAGPPSASPVTATIRFHIHPDVEVAREDEGVTLSARGSRRWRFETVQAPIELEESVFFASLGGPCETCQIVLTVEDARNRQIAWRFSREP